MILPPRYLTLATGLALLFAAARIAWVLCGMPEAPVYDEWSAVDGIALPVAGGTFDPHYLWAPHNQHILFWTKLLDWLQLRLSDNQIDPRPAALLAALLGGVAGALLLAGGVRYVTLGRLPFLLAGIALVVLPYAWENLTEGWGNSYLFLIAGAAGTLGLAAFGRGIGAAMLLPAAVLLSVLAMGSGALAPALGIGLVAGRARRGDLPRGRALWFGAVQAAGVVLAAVLLSRGDTNAVTRPASGFALGLLQIALVTLVFLPTALLARQTFRRDAAIEGTARADRFVVALAVWGYLHVLMMIAVRAEFRVWFPISRYMDVLSVALMANVACALALAARSAAGRVRHAAAAAVRILALVAVLAAPLPIGMYAWQVERWTNATELIRREVHDPGGALGQADASMLPHPYRAYLEAKLADPRVWRILGDRNGDRPAPAEFIAGSRAVESWLGAGAPVLLPLAIGAALGLIAAAFRHGAR